ncbi:hypothetical protein M427DRAFT_202634 [Gonapodya prolifera JEL478]|uniref:Uncharacterized protein n=1 Tax=Gonapodya prolifera (strain JEL478) TaxID=1344416 RepID=A0A139A040_GONPJ|nr:hypothetical protein M427DRAFT_202634 [Gonapodya prolifera JEL478]|eukprot:KXS09905.1 hypothetical protein M427DRAFT_202634 [Gonapodya prolifera JEL478]
MAFLCWLSFFNLWRSITYHLAGEPLNYSPGIVGTVYYSSTATRFTLYRFKRGSDPPRASCRSTWQALQQSRLPWYWVHHGPHRSIPDDCSGRNLGTCRPDRPSTWNLFHRTLSPPPRSNHPSDRPGLAHLRYLLHLPPALLYLRLPHRTHPPNPTSPQPKSASSSSTPPPAHGSTACTCCLRAVRLAVGSVRGRSRPRGGEAVGRLE